MDNRGQEFTATINWDEYWEEWAEGATEEYRASVSGGHVERVTCFLEDVGIPDNAAFVGCGPGSLAVEVAKTYPTMQVFGFDASKSVIERNRETYEDVPNIMFEQAALPSFNVDQQFDFVFCYATLHYVREIERAIENLYVHVLPDGHLVFNYPNDAYRDNHRDVEGQLRERLQLAVNGQNLLSQERIAELLDADTRDFWEVIDADGPFVRPANPCVIVDR